MRRLMIVQLFAGLIIAWVPAHAEDMDTIITYTHFYYSGNPTSSVDGLLATNEFAVRISPSGEGQIVGIWFYIVENPTFKYQLYGGSDAYGKPSSPYFETPPTYYGVGVGWKYIDISYRDIWTYGSDFWVSMVCGYLHPYLGVNGSYDGGRSYKYAYGSWTQDYSSSYFIACDVAYTVSTSVFDETEAVTIPGTFALHQNHPNPFNASTVISFETQAAGLVKFEIFNILGQRVLVQELEVQSTGSHTVSWNGLDQAGKSVPSGIYFYRVSADGLSQSRKMVLLK